MDKDKLNLKHNKLDKEPTVDETPPSVSAGPIARIVELALNSSMDKELEFTVLDANQARLLPQLGLVDLMWKDTIEVATYRKSAVVYEELYKRLKPIAPNLIAEYKHLTAQCQKSVRGTNLKSAIDLALAETETRAGEEEGVYGGHDPWKD